eukprot:scaffold106877_cov39-Phaeocystis_antarctica.AAC.1
MDAPAVAVARLAPRLEPVRPVLRQGRRRASALAQPRGRAANRRAHRQTSAHGRGRRHGAAAAATVNSAATDGEHDECEDHTGG